MVTNVETTEKSTEDNCGAEKAPGKAIESTVHEDNKLDIPLKMEENGVGDKEGPADSPTSVLSDEGASVDSDAPIITEAMLEEEKRLAEERDQQEIAEAEALSKLEPQLDQTSFSKLDELLSKTQIYSQFLLEKMDDIAISSIQNGSEEQEDKKAGKGTKRKGRKAAVGRAQKKAKDAKEAMNAHIAKVEETEADAEIVLEGMKFMTEEERCFKEQMEICPLLTGGRLKHYQLKGIKWMISLWQNGLNGILADQMGLGKTVQTIGLFAHLKGRGSHGPFLVVAPLSTLSNWVSEIKRFVPTMKVLLYHAVGKQGRAELRRDHMPAAPIDELFPVIITSYEVAMNDRRHLAKYKWKYIVVDEGHRLKNFDCRLLRELKQLSAENLLLLTGTPLQNNLPELWSLLNFILPDIFTSLTEFQSWFDLAGKQKSTRKEDLDDEKTIKVVSKLHEILRPFLLRRLKKDVEKSIPKKKEIILYTPMTQKQKDFHDHLVQKTLNEYFEEKGENPGAMLKARLNNVMMQLRKNCNHPDLFVSYFETNCFDYPPVDELVAQCAKMKLLDRLLLEMKERGHKVLLFSQMTKVLDLLEYYLIERGHNPCRLDGSVKQTVRQQQIKEFNEEKSRFVFLLSTRAGGLGINLTSADTVIIYDSDWNPHMDMQAMDRCHRIGQTRPVHVYRLATANSVECRMLKVATGKLKLEHLVIERGSFKQERESAKVVLQEEDFLALLKNEQDEEEEHIQSREISDEDLAVALDRRELQLGTEECKKQGIPVLTERGPGWEEVIQGGSGGNLLSSIEAYRKVQ